MTTRVSLLIPNRNGAELLPRCIASVRNQRELAAEPVVIDNGSSDHSRDAAAGAKWLEGAPDWGFARAINEGVRQTDSEWVALFNNDAWLDPNWGAAVSRAMRMHPQASMFASLGVSGRDHSLYYSLGDIFNHAIVYRAGYLKRRAALPPATLPNEVAGPSGYCGLYHRSLFERLGLLEEAFGSYFEDADFNLRCQRAGHRCPLVKDAVVFHLGAATGCGLSSDWSFQSGRNGVWFVRRHFGLGLDPRAFGQVVFHYILKQLPPVLHGHAGNYHRLRGALAGMFGRCPRIFDAVPGGLADEVQRRLDDIWRRWDRCV